MRRLFSIFPRDFRVPIRRVLVVPFVLQICATVGLVGYLSFLNSQQTVQSLTSQLRMEVSARIQKELQGYFETPHEINRLNATALIHDVIDVANATRGEAQLYQQMRIAPNIAFVYCGNNRGDFFGVLRAPEDGSLQLSYSNAATKGKRQYYMLNVRGQRTYFSHQLTETFDARQRPWYRAATQAQQPVWTDVYIAFTTRLPNITAGLPVYDRSGQRLLGVCAADVVLPEEFRDFLRELEIGKSGQAFVMDREGRLISSSADEPLMLGDQDDPKFLQAVNSQDPIVQGTTQYILDHFGSLQEIVRSRQLNFQLEGKRHFVQVLPFNDGRGLDWLIVVAIPETDFMGQIYANNRNTIGLMLLALGIAIGIGLLITRWLTQPVLRITQASEAISKGALNRRDLRLRESQTGPISELRTLASAFDSMASQLKTSFETLEDKVRERTAELANANAQISTLNDKLKAENLRMGAELDVVRRIQQMILPKDEELRKVKGLDIVGFMEPADEVGGDYYDVLQTGDIVTLGIGDVTGHGLESGMLMLMTQTAVRTLQEIQEHDPIKFLETLNRTIYQNVQRMDSEKNLTLAILNYSDGCVSISGQHEEILIVRADSTIESIDTIDLGMPIGLDDNIADFINYVSVQLQPGDGVVLYTDGIPEAYNLYKKQYGMSRLYQVIAHSWSGTADEVKQAIIHDVKAFIGAQKVFDDITLLILKRR
ncbi:serine phosphatase regulator of sigma subunit [Leptolyngbya sp. Heron Island J]|uniref:SpoIIE family protein phosphatase n=1 Tax=Leptolyngbya sp. Heron Island J TaxID=1385935 RepID=UPI0003B9FAE2|nr:SpoIIE family protein phosphatase [Leptolyngbya sp. Heron Island J]ESA36184.1 serine phosphatase regulator of sigma subunit [Leptolyngbya sp. Heron Island J]